MEDLCLQSLPNKLTELSVFFNTSLLNLDVLWFSEHWLIDEHITTLITDQYKLADNFSKVKCNYGGTCIFVQEDSYMKELKHLEDVYSEK